MSYGRKLRKRWNKPLDYPGAGANLGSYIGSYIGGPSGSALGRVVGGGAHRLMKTITGFGDYKVTKNAILHPAETPYFKPSTNGNLIVAYREYIGDVVSGGIDTFFATTYTVNPGIALTFPWVSDIADNFDEWVPHGIVFQFKSNSADALNSTNTALGTVVMASQYNPYSPRFVNKQEMEQSLFSSSCRPSVNMLHPIECDPSQTRPVFNTRKGDVPPTADSRLYDICNFTIATDGMQAANVSIGELWVTYMIEFRKPVQGDASLAFDHYQIVGATTAAYFGASPVKTPNSNLGIALGATTIQFPNTAYYNVLITYNLLGDAGTWIGPVFTGTAGATSLNILEADTNNDIQSSFLAAQTRIQGFTYFKITGGGLITLSGATLPTNVTAGDVVITVISTIQD